MKTLLFVCVAAFAVVSFAADVQPTEGKPPVRKVKKIDRKHLEEVLYKYNGPKLSVPGAIQGKIGYVNAATKRVPAQWLKDFAATIQKDLNVAIEVTEGPFDLSAPKLVGNASLFIVDDEKLPSLLLAPEARWCMVNIAPLAKGAGEKTAFFAARVQKELMRGFALLAGAQDSNYPRSLMGCITKPEDLDRFVDNRLPVDVLARFKDYVAGYGVKPDIKVSYKKACREGWAPAPTNDVEKAIWDKIHALPAAPLAIKPETKKVSE